jgi:hypothetical protein
MERMKVLVGILVAGLVVVACQPAGEAPSPGSSSRPGAAGQSGDGVPETGAPAETDPGSLRVSTSGWKTDFTRASVDLGDFRGGGPPKDGIPSVDAPVFESIEAARAWLTDQSPVISLEIGGAARAYPLAILVWHEIVNDTLHGTPVVVTFCPLCNTALVYERTIDGTTHDFGTTGSLRFSDLVMYDRLTESWWQQATGEALVGELVGTRLRFVPAQIVSFAAFAQAHPDGDVLSRETGVDRDYGRNPYTGYDEAGSNPFLFEGVVDGRLAPKERVVTIDPGGSPTAFPFTELRTTGVATGTDGGRPVVIFWVPGMASALDADIIDRGEDVGSTGVFLSSLDGAALTFLRDGFDDAQIRDLETGSTWSITGRATAGPLAGSQLQPVPHGNHFWFAWAAFSPNTTIWTAP